MLVVLVLVVLNEIHGANQQLKDVQCPPSRDCTWKYSKDESEFFRCTNHHQCPPNHLCCEDCHFEHSLCKPSILFSTYQQESITNRSCPEDGKVCSKKLPHLITQSYECSLDYECVGDLICCEDNCYTHKICKENAHGRRQATKEYNCPEERVTCEMPYLYEETKKHECLVDSQCGEGHLCCPDSCYEHKICKSISGNANVSQKGQSCPYAVKKELCLNTNTVWSERYSCKTADDCFPGYLCCPDNCFDHNLCKAPSDRYSYKTTGTPTTILPREEEEDGRCPQVSPKCERTYSLRLAKKLMCHKDEDCSNGQICCKDSCVKDFKICVVV